MSVGMDTIDSVVTSFHRYAWTYDDYATVQQDMAGHLLSLLPEGSSSILDVGCGTGGMTSLLVQQYLDAVVVGVDPAPDMIACAVQNTESDRLTFICSDLERFSSDSRFDLVVSNATFQWILSDPVSRSVSFLNPGGDLCWSTFGPQTFCELGQCFSHLGWDMTLPSAGFPSLDCIQRGCDGVGKIQHVETRLYTPVFGSISDLLRSIKYSGVQGAKRRGGGLFWTPHKIRALEQCYLDLFGAIQATYEGYFLCLKRF